MKNQPMRTVEEIMNPSHTALIVVDMQRDFCTGEGSFARSGLDVSAVRAIIPPVQRLLEAARKAGVLPVFLQQMTLPGAAGDGDAWLAFKTRDGKSPEYALAGSEGMEMIPELSPRREEICVPKCRPSGFHGTFLDQILRANGIRTVLVCGTRTEGCVLATVLDASFYDYYTCVAEDCVASSSLNMQEAALAIMRSRYLMLNSEEIIRLWSVPPAV